MSSKSAPKHACMGCQATIASPLFCFSCNAIQRLSARPNYFEIFDLAYSYDLDSQQLEEKYQVLAAELHPDFYLTASTFEKRQSQESSALLNQAYQTLKSSTGRADYLLKLLSHGKSFSDRKLPPGFLEEMFEKQELLEEWLSEPEKYLSELDQLKRELTVRLEELDGRRHEAFASLEEETSSGENILELIQINLNVERYLQRLLDRLARSL